MTIFFQPWRGIALALVLTLGLAVPATAQDQARLALAELRDLVRGIAPAILLDRGLVPALAALAARSPVPTSVSSTLPDGERLPDAAERAAYFAVAEALVNVAKHAAATRCTVRCRREGQLLVVEVEDDGGGGARASWRAPCGRASCAASTCAAVPTGSTGWAPTPR